MPVHCGDGPWRRRGNRGGRRLPTQSMTARMRPPPPAWCLAVLVSTRCRREKPRGGGVTPGAHARPTDGDSLVMGYR